MALSLALSACSSAPIASPSPTASTGVSATSGPTAVPTATLLPTAAVTAEPTAAVVPSAPLGAGFPVLPGSNPGVDETAVACTGPIGASDPVAIVGIDATAGTDSQIVLRDYADPAKPRTACTFKQDGFGILGLIDGQHVLIESWDEAGLYAVVDVPDVRYRWIQLPPSESGYQPSLMAVAPSLDRVVWASLDPEVAQADELHVTSATGDTVVATMPDANTGRCGGDDESKFGSFRQQGSLAYVLNQPLPGQESLVVLDGTKILYSLIAPSKGWADAARPQMPVWSPVSDTLYFRRGTNVERWTPDGGVTRFLTGVRWQYPTISPDGRQLAYAAPRADGTNDVYLVDLAHGGSPQRIGSGRRNFPSFLNNTQLWYIATGSGAGCTGGDQKNLVYNLTTRSEAASIIGIVWAAWPATSSNR